MTVRQCSDCSGLSGAGQLVPFRQALFSPGVDNDLSIAVLRQMLNRSTPVVRFIQRDFCTIAQRDFQFGRTDTILVIRVVPNLPDCRFGLFG